MKNKRNLGKLVPILLFTIIFLLLSGIPAFANEYFSIEPGWRVGPIIITMTKVDIERVYGTGEIFIIPDVDKNVKLTMLQYKNLGLNFIFKFEQLEEIEINKPNFQLKEVVKVGCKVSQVEEVLGKNCIVETYQHAEEPNLPDYRMIYSGIIFYVKKDRVAKIAIVRKK